MPIGFIRTTALVLEPVSSAAVPAGAVFRDESNDSVAGKSTGGADQPIGGSGGTSEETSVKLMQNLSGSTIIAGKPVAKKPDGSVVQADSDGVGTQVVIGAALENITNGATGKIALIGPNVPSAIAGLGFTPGQEVYLSKSAGYTNSLVGFDASVDTIIRMGYADCPAGSASATATDMIMAYQDISRPG